MHKPVSGLVALVVTTALLSVTSPADAANRYIVTVSASTASTDVGQSVSLRGKVSPRAVGQRVKVQRLTGSGWKTIRNPRLNRHSRYRATVKVTAPGDNVYRVVKPRSNGRSRGVSPTVIVVGWRWRAIVDLPIVGLDQHTTMLPTGQLGGQSFSPFVKQSSAGAGSSADRSFALDGKCTALDLYVGATPDSATDDLNWPYLYGYLMSAPEVLDSTLWSHSVQKSAAPIHVVLGASQVAPLARIRLHSEFDVSANAVGWGGARVYCRS